MEQQSPRPAQRTSFGQQLKQAQADAKRALKNQQQNAHRRAESGMVIVHQDKPVIKETVRPVNAKAAELAKAKADKAAELQAIRDEAKRQKEKLKAEKRREKEREAAIAANKKIALLDVGMMGKGHVKTYGRDKVFKTVPFTKDGKIEVRVDHNTVIYVNPGADIEAAKAKILNRHDKYKQDQKPGLKAATWP